ERGAPNDVIPFVVGAVAGGDFITGALVKASLFARFGIPARARDALAQLGSIPIAGPETFKSPVRLCLAADAAMRLGDRELATALLPALSALEYRAVAWGAFGYIWEGPVAQYAGGLHAVLEHWDDAVAAWDDALATCDAIGARPFAAQARRELAAALAGR